MLFEVANAATSAQLDNAKVQKIAFPILAGGPSTCDFTAFQEIELNTEIEIKEKNGLVSRFEGYVRKRSRTRNKEKYLGQEWQYTAVCKAYYEEAQKDYNITEYTDELLEFSGNGVEYYEWLYQENANTHILWPPTGTAPIIWLDTETATSLPSNIISVSEVEENSLPSHVKIEVKKYREKRFPAIADFTPANVTGPMLKNDPAYADYGRKYKIMDPDDPTQEYNDAPLYNATVGGSRFYCKGHTGYNTDSPKRLDYNYSASINTKKKKRTLEKVGGAAGTNTDINSQCTVQMVFLHNYELPRVAEVHGTEKEQSECYVRARVLEGVYVYTQEIGGINKQDRLPSVNHTEIEVEYDSVNDGKYRDWTYNGPKGLLHPTDDLGGGVWNSDLSGTYIEEEGVSRAATILSKALAHYENVRFTTDFSFAGVNWDKNKKITYEGKEICLDNVVWTFSEDPTKDNTKYNGIRLLYGFSPNLRQKMKLLVRQEQEREEKRNRKQPAVVPHGDSEEKTRSYARIAWNYDTTNGDMTEGEIVTKNDAGQWTGTQNVIWIDEAISQGTTFKTAGDETIFEVEKVIDALQRGLSTRECYRIIRCFEDNGTKFSHFATDNKDPLICTLIGDDVSNPSWQEIYDGTKNIKTNIYNTTTEANEEITNKMKVLLLDEWDNTGSGDFLYLEKSVHIHNYPFAAIPIKPRLKTKSTKLWESAVELNGSSIATYTRK